MGRPRKPMGKRIDAVVVSGAVVFVIEFKVGEKHFTRADPDQAWDRLCKWLHLTA